MNIMNRVTWKNLKENKTRTLVTIIGIMLSVSLFTAVITSVFSLKSYILDVFVEEKGDYHAAVLDVDQDTLEEISSHEKTDQVAVLEYVGYSLYKDIKNKYKPYIFVAAADPLFLETMPVRLTDGRLPQNNQELLIPEHLSTNGGVNLKIGTQLDLGIGTREMEGEQLSQEDFFKEELEHFQEQTKKSYTVVGFYKRPSFENFDAPGYTALTLSDGISSDSYDAYFKVNPMKDSYEFLEGFPDHDTKVNSDILRFTGNSNLNSLNLVLYSMIAILSAIIMFGSISLIYNAFSISISERSKQFGLLKSIGATRKQIKKSVLFEALALSGVGIPLGILLGIGGIAVTFRFTGSAFNALLNEGFQSQLRLRVPVSALVLAALLGVITVLISAYLPAKKAAKKSAIESIRQSDDVKIQPSKVKTSRLTYKLFGFEGMLASKNFKRNKRKYRATVFSLFMSVVLFISASSYTAYLKQGVGDAFPESQYDIGYFHTKEGMSPEDVNTLIASVKGITQTSYEYSNRNRKLFVPSQVINEEFLPLNDQSYYESIQKPKGGETILNMHLIFLDNESFRDILVKNNIAKEDYLQVDKPKALLYPKGSLYDYEENKVQTFKVLKKGSFTARELEIPEEIGDNYFSGNRQGEMLIYHNANDGEDVLYPLEDVVIEREHVLGDIIEKLPMINLTSQEGEVKVIYPVSAMEKVLGKSKMDSVTMYVKADNPQAVYKEMSQKFLENDLSPVNIFNIAAQEERNRALINVINIFSFGFIILISLIAAANVFNTISTNIHLRKREFAMLKTVGMTPKSFKKMMTFESILYGLKGLLYGLPVAICVTYLIYLAMSNGIDFEFFIPWYSLIIAIGSVFVVVFSTSAYGMSKIRQHNPIDALKSENT